MSKKSIDRRWLPLNALRAFEVREARQFHGRCERAAISQSALSRHVIALERLIGVQLFDRKPHALSLTKAGSAPASRCREVIRPARVRAGRHPQ